MDYKLVFWKVTVMDKVLELVLVCLLVKYLDQ